MDARWNARFDEMDPRWDARFVELDDRIQATEQRLREDIAVVRDDVATVRGEVTALRGRVDVVQRDVAQLGERMARVETIVEDIRDRQGPSDDVPQDPT